MIRLTSAMTLNAVLTAAKTLNDIPSVVGFSDDSTSGYAGSSTLSVTNGVTPVAICSAPAVSTIRDIDYVNIYNADTAAKTIQIYITASAVNYLLIDVTLQVDDKLTYTHANGWNVTDINGNIKTTLSGGIASQLTASGWASPAGPIGSTAPVQYYNRVSPTVTAAGTTQGTATLLVAERNRITTAPVGSGVILFTPIIGGLDIWVDNDTVNALDLYPQVGAQIDVLGINNPMIIPPGGSVMLSAASTTQWDSYLSNDPAFRNISAYGITTAGSGTGVTISNTNTTTAQQEQIGGSITTNVSGVRALYISSTITGGASTTQLSGFQNQLIFTPIANGTAIYGLINLPVLNSAVSVGGINGAFSRVDLGAAALGGTITSAFAFQAGSPVINASATTNITTYSQFHAIGVVQGAAQTITTVYGFYGGIAALSGRWNCYMAGGANNAFQGNVRFGGVAVPTAHIHSSAGSAAAGSAPLMIDSGTLTTTPVAGQFEYNNTWYMTDSTPTRRQIGSTNYTTAESAITPPASTVAYQNATGYDADVLITGGTVTLIEFSRNGTAWYTIGAAVSGFVPLSPLDRVRVTYTVAPTMTLIPR